MEEAQAFDSGLGGGVPGDRRQWECIVRAVKGGEGTLGAGAIRESDVEHGVCLEHGRSAASAGRCEIWSRGCGGVGGKMGGVENEVRVCGKLGSWGWWHTCPWAQRVAVQ